jgi:thiol-disulfide isomerase/thioredoxin
MTLRFLARLAACFIISLTLLAAEEEKKPADVKLQILDWQATQKLVASKKGKIVVLDAWSTSCLPCIREFPNLVALQKSHADDVACISLNLDYIGLKSKPPEFYRERVLKFLNKQNSALDNVLCSEESEVMFEKLGVPSIPAVLVYDRAGKLAKTFDNSDAENEDEGFTYKDVTAFVDELKAK